MSNIKPAYKRVLLKLSGEALMGDQSYGIDPTIINKLAEDVVEILHAGVEVAIVLGGGNIFRGEGLAKNGIARVTGDHMGMLATVMNGLALQDAVEKLGEKSRVMSGLSINEVCEDYIQRRAVRHLEKGRIVILVAGTGNPFFTTDTGASLRSIEIGADIMLKATKVNGVYSADPMKDAGAVRYERLSYDDVLQQNLQVMDQTAIVQCRDNDMPMQVFNMNEDGALRQAIEGSTTIGTIIGN